MPVLKVICQEHPHFSQNDVGKYKDDNALHDVIAYCGRADKACCVGGIGVYPPNAVYEMERLARAYGKDQGVRLRHWVLSFSRDELKRIGKKALPAFIYNVGWYAASYYGHQYQIIFAIHMDTENPHIHFVMNTVNYRTGKKYPMDKEDYYRYQQYLRDFLHGYGMALIPAADQPI